MQAILELLIAVIQGILAAIAGVVFAAVQLAFTTIEFLIAVVTMGLGPAKERARKSSDSGGAQRENRLQFRWKSHPKSLPSASSQWLSICLLMGITVAGICAFVSARIRANQIETAKKLVNQRTNDIAAMIALGNAPPARGKLPIRDPWGESLELFLDDIAVGTLVVVRSAGPDRKTGTIDDLLGIRMQQKGAKQMAEDLGAQAKAKVMKLLKRENQDDR